jgi:hypothetical protein
MRQIRTLLFEMSDRIEGILTPVFIWAKKKQNFGNYAGLS